VILSGFGMDQIPDTLSLTVSLAEGEISQAEYDSIQTNIVNKDNPQFMVAKKDKKRIREGLD
jgi:hypothetical protein